MRETELYPAVKALLEGQGYEVKAEIGKCDVVGVRGNEPPVIVEMKTNVSLTLFLQGIDRLAVADAVYLAVPRGKTKAWRRQLRDTLKLCRRLGLGFISVTGETADVHLDPGPYAPRKIKRRENALLREFLAREGDPNEGGATRTKLVTAYRQEAMRVAACLAQTGPDAPAKLAKAADAPRAAAILYKNYYGWFFRVSRGVYDLTDAGQAAVVSQSEDS